MLIFSYLLAETFSKFAFSYLLAEKLSCLAVLSENEFVIVRNLGFISWKNFMLSRVEHEERL